MGWAGDEYSTRRVVSKINGRCGWFSAGVVRNTRRSMRPFVGAGGGRPCCGKVYQALGLPSTCFCFKHILGVCGRVYLNHKLTRLDGGHEFPFQVITFHKIAGCNSGPTAGLVLFFAGPGSEAHLLPVSYWWLPCCGRLNNEPPKHLHPNPQTLNVILYGTLQMWLN